MTTYSPFELEPIFIDFKNESYNLGLDIQANQNDTLTLNFICRNNGIEEDMTKYKVELRVHNNNANVDYIQTQNENVTLGADGSVKIVCQSLKGNKLTAYNGQLNGVLRIFNTENKQKATRIITMRIVADPLETDRTNICESTITKLEDLDWILNEAYNIEDEFKKAIEEAIKQKSELTAKISESVTAKNNLNSTIQTANNTNNTLNATNTTAINTKNELNTLNTTANTTKNNLDKSNVTALGTNKTLSDTNTTAINTNNTLNATINNANKSKSDLDTSKNNADKSKSALDGSVSTGNTLKTNLDGSIAIGTTLKNDIDNRITTGNKLKTDLDNSSTVATSKKEILDTANVQAEKNIEILNSFGDASQLTKDVTTLKTKVLENTLTSIETDSTLTKLDNCENGFVRNMQIMGRTLQNICKTKGGAIKPNGSLALGLTYMFKQNTIYTLIVNSKANSLDGTIKIVLETPNIYPGVIVNKGEIGLKTFKFQTPNIQTGMSIYTDSSTIGECILDGIMILEGDYTNKEIPSYFEGIKSVGEVEGNKISILSRNKNFCDSDNINFEIKDLIASDFIPCFIPKNNKFTFVVLNSNNTPVKNSGNVSLHFYDKNKQFIDYKSLINNPRFCDILNKDAYYLKIDCAKDNGVNEAVTKIVINLGDTTKNYVIEESKVDKTEILTGNEPLKGLPSGASDVIDVEKNEITRNIGKAVLNGSESNWNKINTNIENNIVSFQNELNAISTGYIVNYLSSLPTYTADYLWNKLDSIGVAINATKKVQCKVEKSRLETPDVAGFKKYLQANPVTIYYQLDNPVTEKLNIKDTLQTFKDGYIQLNNAITPTTYLEYSTNIPSAIGGLTKVVDHNVDEITNIESTISDMDAEIEEARNGKITLNERLEEDKTNILNKIGDLNTLSTEVKTDLVGALNENVLKTKNNTNNIIKPIYSITKNIYKKKIKIIGDSITAGYGGTGYNCDGQVIYGNYRVNASGHCWANSIKQYLESTFSCTVSNFGITGINSIEMVNHLSDLIKSDDDIIICMIGTNNRLLTDGNTQLKKDLITIYNYVKNINKEIIFMSSIPATIEDDKTRYLEMKDIDNVFMITCSELNIEYISLYKLFIEYLENKDFILSEVLSDTVHPNDIGYDIMYYLVLRGMGLGINKSLPNLQKNFKDTITLVNDFERVGNDPFGIARSGNIVVLQLSIKNKNLISQGMTICNLQEKYFKNAPNCIGYLYDEKGEKYKIIIFNDGRVDLYTQLQANTGIWGTLTYIV